MNIKKDYISLDLFKFIFALMVVCIHVPIFRDINSEASFFVNQIICRLAVPYFFITSGFLLKNKIKEKKAVKVYIIRILKLYILYTAIYIPQIFNSYNKEGIDFLHMIIKFFYDFFLIGSYIQLWYFLALITSIVFIYVLTNKTALKEKNIFYIFLFFYIIGVLINAYSSIINNCFFYNIIIKIFQTTRNGFFFGPLYVYLGYLIAVNDINIKRKGYWNKLFISLTILVVEAYFARHLSGMGNKASMDMLFTMPIITYYCFLGILNIDKCRIIKKHNNITIYLRNMSTLIFGLHVLINGVLNFLFKYFISINYNSLIQYISVVLITIVVSIILIKLSNNKLQCLKTLY